MRSQARAQAGLGRRLARALVHPLAMTAMAVGLSLGGTVAQAQPGSSLLAACAACHGADGRSELKDIPSLAGQPKIFLENQLVLIREGMREIPAMKAVMAGVSDAQITELAQHYASQSLPTPPAPARPELFERGKAVADASRCGICHLPDYRGREQMPRLAAQREDYLLYSMRQFISNQAVGRDTIMAASLHGVADADLQALAYYLAHLKP